MLGFGQTGRFATPYSEPPPPVSSLGAEGLQLAPRPARGFFRQSNARAVRRTVRRRCNNGDATSR